MNTLQTNRERVDILIFHEVRGQCFPHVFDMYLYVSVSVQDELAWNYLQRLNTLQMHMISIQLWS